MSKQRLGRGLSALLEEMNDGVAVEVEEDGSPSADVTSRDGLQMLPLEALEPNPDQPRKRFTEDELRELSESISQQGLLQPILVRPLPGDNARFQIIAGERRWRAADKAGLEDVPVLVRDLTDREVLEVALVENMQRADLNPLEEATAFQALTEQFGYTQEQIARAVSKSRSHIANTMRLLALPDAVRQRVAEGTLTAGHARAIATSEHVEALADQIVTHGYSVRDAERLARGEMLEPPAGAKGSSSRRAPGAAPAARSGHLADLERDLEEALGLNVGVRDYGQKGGEIRIRYSTIQQLDSLVGRLLQR